MPKLHASRVLALSAALFALACGLPEKYTTDRENFAAALDAYADAAAQLEAAAGGAGTVQMTESLRTSMLATLENGLTSAESVSDEFLDWMAPELKSQFRDNLIEGQRQMVAALRGNDPSRLASVQQRLDAWAEYYNANSEKLNKKAKP